MSDLCYNCGDCHLPRPCPIALRFCDICHNMGHTYNFCPKSVRLRDPSYQFWALCHNCDKWHLPQACEFELYQCRQCGHGGHREFFCPIKAVSRSFTIDAQTGMKRQRTNDSGDDGNTGTAMVHPEVIRRIKLDATHEVLNLIGREFNYDQIIQYMGYLPMAASNGNTKAENTIKHDVGPKYFPNGAPVPSVSSPHVMVQPATPTSATHSTLAAAAMQLAQHGGTNENGVYTSMHQRFDRGDLAKTQAQDSSNNLAVNMGYGQDHMKLPLPESATQVTQGGNGGINSSGPAHGTQGWTMGTLHADMPNMNTTFPNQGNNATNDTPPYNESGNVEQVLESELVQHNMAEHAQADLTPGMSLPSMISNSNNSNIQPNPLQQTPMPVAATQPQLNHTTEGDSIAVASNAPEVPAPELRKNGEPKKKQGRTKRKTQL